MRKYWTCPHCGHLSIREKEHCIQELDSMMRQFESPAILTEFECKVCGWLAVASSVAA